MELRKHNLSYPSRTAHRFLGERTEDSSHGLVWCAGGESQDDVPVEPLVRYSCLLVPLERDYAGSSIFVGEGNTMPLLEWFILIFVQPVQYYFRHYYYY